MPPDESAPLEVCRAGCSACCHDRTGTGRWVELDPALDDVPAALTWTDDEQRRFMRHVAGGACVALLAGRCTIYAARPRVCRDFPAGSWQCASAQARFERALAKPGGDGGEAS